MLTICWSAKGGSGTTVVACAMALLAARRGDSMMLIDLAGDAPAALGVPEPSGPGVHDWVVASTTPPSALAAISLTGEDNLQVVPAGSATASHAHPRWAELGEHLAEAGHDVIVDAGTSLPPSGLLDACTQNLLIIRPCYLAVRRAAAAPITPSAIIVVHEPGRALRALDIVAAVGAPVAAEVPIDPLVGRAVDAGLLLARMPRSLSTGLREIAA